MNRGTGRAPIPLLVGFALFLVAMGYLVAASFTRRSAPTFAAGLEARGDTLTVDATDSDRWRYLSLARGRVLAWPDTARWEVAARRYNMVVNGETTDLGPVDFDATKEASGKSTGADSSSIGKWYRYSLLTHLLESNRHVYVVRTAGQVYKLQVVSYYCPGLTAGCMTIRFAPLASD